MDNIHLVIPSYKPQPQLVSLIGDFRTAGFRRIIVVRDGGGAEYDPVFQQIALIPDVTILEHGVNLGKGRGLKTAINHMLVHHPEAIGIVTADADGQHLPIDAFAVAEALKREPNALVLGVRDFSAPEVPFRSKNGNRITRLVFLFFTGIRLSDTQTGLRGIPASMFARLASVKGERYEYETNMLLDAKEHDVPFVEVPIQTVYIDDNRGSHFHTFFDSLKIYRLLFGFAMSAILAFVVDYLVFALIFYLNDTADAGVAARDTLTLLSFIGARLVSGNVNFFTNKHLVFKGKTGFFKPFLKYWLLVLIFTTITYLLTRYASHLTGGHYIIMLKFAAEIALFSCSFLIQRAWVFKSR